MCLAMPGELIARIGSDPLLPMGQVAFGGLTKDVCLAYVPEVKVGDYVIVHAGFAISILDTKQAERLLSELDIANSKENQNKN